MVGTRGKAASQAGEEGQKVSKLYGALGLCWADAAARRKGFFECLARDSLAILAPAYRANLLRRIVHHCERPAIEALKPVHGSMCAPRAPLANR
jgi:hypothetical protein